jgi:hypothetical protein
LGNFATATPSLHHPIINCINKLNNNVKELYIKPILPNGTNIRGAGAKIEEQVGQNNKVERQLARKQVDCSNILINLHQKLNLNIIL